MLRFLAGAVTLGFLAVTTAWGQADYATPYLFTTIVEPGQFVLPEGLVADTNDNLYVVDNYNYTVVKVAPAGVNWTVTPIAGPAQGLYQPTSITMDQSNNLYVTDGFGDNTVRKLTLTGGNWVATTIAGNANNLNYGVDGTNGAAAFKGPSGIVADAAGNLYVADTYDETIRMIVPMGTNWVVTTIAGSTGATGSDDGTNQSAQFDGPTGIAVDGATNLYVADVNNNTIRQLKPVGTNWVVSTIAGNAGNLAGLTDGTNGDAQFNFGVPTAIAVDTAGNLYVADYNNSVIRKVAPVGTNWVVTTLAGASDIGTNDGAGSHAQFTLPAGITVDLAGRLFVSDSGEFPNGTIRKGIPTAIPNLAISLTALNAVVVSWPGPFGTLQTNGDLTPANWGYYNGAVTTSNGTNSVTLAPLAGHLYFRLTD